MKFQKTYIEISNICNLQCSFCPVVERDKKILKSENFEFILKQVAPHTEQVCLHLMGEPLTHPEFEKILSICDQQNVRVNLTTNGTQLGQYDFDLFYGSSSLRQINFSLHSFLDNFPIQDFRPYLFDILTFSRLALKEKPDLYINYRLWNLEHTQKIKDSNDDIIQQICHFFDYPLHDKIDVSFRKSQKITGRIYFHFDTQFEWPSLDSPIRGTRGFCHALTQHIAIHADGTVVPCCLDKESGIKLGNIFEKSYEDILLSPRLQNMKKGFEKRILTEELCQKCTYISRFKS